MNENLQVHGMENLFVCSNAVFPNLGAVNPTLTLTALALRLAEFLGGSKVRRNPKQVDNKAKLLGWLQKAIELELATIPPYLVALLSIELQGNREPAELIRSVMIEEMLHLVLVSNVLNAVGGHLSIAKNVSEPKILSCQRVTRNTRPGPKFGEARCNNASR